VLEEGLNPSFDEYDIEDELGEIISERSSLLSEKEKNTRLRLALGAFTIVLMVIGPVLQFYYADIFLYILAAGIAFTIGTNLTIGILSIRIEDKAELMERRMSELLEQLSTSTDQLTEFNGQLAQFPLQTMLETLETARSELEPTLSQMGGVSWEEISRAVTTALEWSETLDTDKIKSLMSPFVVETPIINIDDDPFNDEAVQIDFFPPPPPRHRG